MFRTSGAGMLLVAVGAVVAGSAGPVGAQAPSDAEIAHIAVTANAIDVELAELALERARSEGVREFARRMITDHTAVNEEAAALAARLGVTPASNAVSRSLRDDAEAAGRSLRGASGAAFDREYMDREVAYHRAVLEALDETLIPSVRNEELRDLLEQARGAVAAHLAHAEELRSALHQGW